MIQTSMDSQRGEASWREMSPCLEFLRIRRAAVYWTFWRRTIKECGQPERRELAVAPVVRRRRMKLIRRRSKLAVGIWLTTLGLEYRWQSRVTPILLIVTENGTDVLPVAKESRIEKEVDILLGEIIMISVLSSLSFTLLSVIHSFIIMFFAMPHSVSEAGIGDRE